MTIGRRLFWSNILMIALPTLAAAAAGLFCAGLLWLFSISGANLSVNDREVFGRASRAAAELVKDDLKDQKDFSRLEKLLAVSGMRAVIEKDGVIIYAHGEETAADSALLASAASLQGRVTLLTGGRSLYRTEERARGESYTIYLFGGEHGDETYAALKDVLKVGAGLIALAILLAIFAANRFLTRFMLRRIEEPLGVLSAGVARLRDGDLSCRLKYSRADEFRPICESFNEMAFRLQSSKERERREERSRRELIAGISHDLRSPLTSIRAYVEGILDGIAATPEKERKYLLTIRRKAEDLDGLISMLFLYSKMDLGEFRDTPALIDLAEEISALTCELREEYAAKGLLVETSLTPARVSIDPLLLKRLVQNIMGNSLKYKEKAQGRLRITLKAEGGYARLDFDDDGPGVPEESLKRLFEVFYRSDPARHSPHKGSGLGLAIAKKIVTHAGGSICAQRSELGGLKVAITLPIASTPTSPKGES